MQHPKPISGKNFLAATVSMAEAYLVDAGLYAAKLSAIGPIKVEVDEFYRTLDGSTIKIVEEISQSVCPICQRAHNPESKHSGPFSKLLMLDGDIKDVDSTKLAESLQDAISEMLSSEEEKKMDNSPKNYVCLIIQGGHGDDFMTGEKPGERYTVDAIGDVILPDYVTDDRGILPPQHLKMLGLSLLHKLKVSIQSI